jgi:hypothetical protein
MIPAKTAPVLAAIQLKRERRPNETEAGIGALVVTVMIVCPLVVVLLSAIDVGLNEHPICAVKELGVHVKLIVPVKPTLLAAMLIVDWPVPPGLSVKLVGLGGEKT